MPYPLRFLPHPVPARWSNTVRAVLATPFLALSLSATPEHEYFEKKVRPLLAEHCYECHAPQHKVKAGLRLDVPQGWLVGGDSGPAVVPGKVDESRLIRAIRAVDNEVEAMPPKSTLSREEVAVFEEWIRRGAHAPAAPDAPALAKSTAISLEEGRRFWSFIPPAAPPLPALTRHADWPRTAIDHLVAARWETHGLAPGPDAGRAAWLRRVTFDLTGLPPTPEQIDAFVADRHPEAFARVVDDLLASPHFGERWGRRWLDVARFAESSGGGRTLLFKDAWRYRDYVIDSFNRDVPFDTFIREQIAGDLLPHTSHAQRSRQLTATAFLALGPTNYEEQNKAALRMDIVDEQLDTIGKAFLGMTIGCARCHDHKFDPIPTQDYYALAGILRSTRTLENYTDNVAKWVDAPLPLDDAASQALAVHERQIAQLEAELKKLRTPARAAAKAAAPAGELAPGKPVPLSAVPGIVIDETKARIVGDWRESTFARNYIGSGYLTDLNEGKGAKTLTFTPALPKSGRYEVRFAYTPNANRAANTPVTILHADGEKTIHLDQRESPPILGRFVSLGTFRFEQNGEGYVLISNEGTTGFVVADAIQFLPVDAPAAPADTVAAQPATDPTVAANLATTRRLEAELRKLKAEGPRRPLTMSVAESDDIGDTEIRIRGNIRTLGPKVPRGFLRVASSGPAAPIPAHESGRRELADWIAGADNPLTARVTVNRVWAWLFGAGIVRSVDNFGTTGDAPTNQPLLDHLARQFVADGWSMKRLVRSIVLSRTYQLASTVSPEQLAADPENRHFARANRRRLDAEQIRDALLWAGGQLKLDVGGPNIGEGPHGAANLPVNAEYTYVFKDTRRSVYTPAFRNKRLELFEVFDFGDTNAPVGLRHVSTVAPQALFLMNHPFVTDQARHAASRTLAAADRTELARIDAAYRLILGRAPTPREREVAHTFVTAPDVEAAATPPADRWAHFFQALFASIDFRYLD